MKEFKTQWNAKSDFAHGDGYEVYDLENYPSQTVPSMEMTARQMMEKQAVGLPVSGNRQIPMYHGDEFVPDFDRMDLIDRQNFIRDAKTQLETIQSEQKTRNDAMKKEIADYEQKQKELEKEKEAPPAPPSGAS